MHPFVPRLQNAEPVVSESEWLIYQVDGSPLGPLSTSAIVDAILAGNLRPDVWIAAPGGSRWLCAKDVPVIAKMIDGLPTRRQSGMRIVTAPLPATPSSSCPIFKKFDDTVKTASPSEQAGAQQPPTPAELGEPETIRSLGPPRGPDGFPIAPPPSSSSSPTPPTPKIYMGGETLESPGQEKRKKTQGA